MSKSLQQTRAFADRLLAGRSAGELHQRLAPRHSRAHKIPRGTLATPERLEERWAALHKPDTVRAALDDPRIETFARNIENYIGTLRVPVGVAGPLRVNGFFAQGDYFLPLATTEAALVASFDRGSHVITEAGGCSALLLSEGVLRAPGLAFRSLADAGAFVLWAIQELDNFRVAASTTTSHGRLQDIRFTVEGNHVYLQLEFSTGAAAGQNMVTIATDAVCRYIREHTPIAPENMFVEANLSGDKKASVQSFLTVRGRKVSAEVTLPAALVAKRLHTTPQMMEKYWRMSAMGGVMSGTIGVQGHYANGLTALYLATGQDAACVAESAVGVTRMEVTATGDLYACVTLPAIIVGTVGGGTGLPGQRACLELLNLHRPEDAPALAEVCGALALAGEISIIGALSAQEFTRAHSRLARGRKKPS